MLSEYRIGLSKMKFHEHEAAYRQALSSLHNGQFSRREVLRKMGAGFGTLGLAGVLQQLSLIHI